MKLYLIKIFHRAIVKQMLNKTLKIKVDVRGENMMEGMLKSNYIK